MSLDDFIEDELSDIRYVHGFDFFVGKKVLLRYEFDDREILEEYDLKGNLSVSNEIINHEDGSWDTYTFFFKPGKEDPVYVETAKYDCNDFLYFEGEDNDGCGKNEYEALHLKDGSKIEWEIR